MYNATAATLARGSTVAYYTDAAGTCDGFSVTMPTANYLDLTAGIVADAPNTSPSASGIATATAGFIVTYGYTPYATLHQGVSDVIAVGQKLIPIAGQTYLSTVGVGDGRDGWFCCLSSYASSSGAIDRNIAVFVRAM